VRGIHWFRNDLRLQDNRALHRLSGAVDQWLPVFVVDPALMRTKRSLRKRDRFMLDCLRRLESDLEKRGVPLVVLHGHPTEQLPRLAEQVGASRLSHNQSSTPYAKRRDQAVHDALERIGCTAETEIDDVIFPPGSIRSGSGNIYSVYTPYRNTWWKRWGSDPQRPTGPIRLPPAIPLPDVQRSGKLPKDGGNPLGDHFPTGGTAAARRRLKLFLDGGIHGYATNRDIPAIDGTSRLSPYLRFGAISVRECFERALSVAAEDPSAAGGVQKWLDELIWREFYYTILDARPRVLHSNDRSAFDSMRWNDDPAGLDAWAHGATGYPIVDAGMRQLRETGWMHNRVRMIVASFLTKDLLIHWREGERVFLEHLIDADPASNNGGWQWAASTGCDSQPYFRILNPTRQAERWDPEGDYIRRWVPELRDMPRSSIHDPTQSPLLAQGYPSPIVSHSERREEALQRYRAAMEEQKAE